MASDQVATRTGPSRPGRPKKFDETAVLNSLVELFWEKGYGATSLDDVVAHTGLSKSSLYNSFGAKDELFAKVLRCYIEQRSEMVTSALIEGQSGLDDIERFLDSMQFEVEHLNQGRGCLAVNTSTELGATNETIVDFGERYRSLLRSGFEAALNRAKERGEITDEAATSTPKILTPFVLGTAVAVRSGAPRSEIEDQIEAAKQLLQVIKK